MKVTISGPVLDQKGKEIKDPKTSELLTLFDVICTGLLGQTDQRIATEEKTRRYKLWKKLEEGKELELSSEEISKIKEAVGEFYSPLIHGRVTDLFEDKKMEEAPKEA